LSKKTLGGHQSRPNERIWDGRGVSDAAISSRIKTARQVLGDDGKVQRLIPTVHGKGFRFIGDLIDEQSAADPATENTVEPPPNRSRTRPTIIVLPFENLSGDLEQEYFADAITQDTISTLSKHRWLTIMASSVSRGYKGQSVDVRSLGSEIGVDYVVEGSVLRSGNQIRVSAQLVDTDSGNQRWADRYDRELKDIFALQDEIAGKIVARLEPEIGTAERRRVVRAERRDLQAWDCYHLGIFHFFKFTASDNLEA
jgi:TolB-like protein